MSCPASEHSINCFLGEIDEIEVIQHLLNTFPTGILSIVADSFDYYKFITEYVLYFKDQILILIILNVFE